MSLLFELYILQWPPAIMTAMLFIIIIDAYMGHFFTLSLVLLAATVLAAVSEFPMV